MKKKFMKTCLAAALSAALAIATVAPAFAAEFTPKYTYSGDGMTFEKVSHANSPTETADGIVDYTGNGSIAPYVQGVSADGNGDRGQSYSYASASYGDWVYINTMYGGLGANAILNRGLGELTPDAAAALINIMYNGTMYTGEPDGKSAGGMLVKFNVKTGETRILMSKDTNGIMPTFRSAIKLNNKLYFVGMIIDANNKQLTSQEIAYATAVQNGFPCIYEVDPANNDKLTCIYNCVDTNGFRQLVKDNVFTSTRAIGTYEDAMIAGALDTNGVFLVASKNPSQGQSSFSVIADMNDLFNYPAYHRSDVNGGGGIYQVLEYNGDLYVVICTGTPNNKNEATGTLQTFAIVKGTCSGDVTNKNAWTWSVLAGDEADGARYPFGLDTERVSAGACTLQVYNDYLYIGDYNDVSSALQGFVLKNEFTTQATNLEQSVNLYRMDKNENIEKVVGDPTEAFPTSLSGLGSGYTSNSLLKKMGTHMNQYTWQTTVYNGKMYVGTMDTTTLLEPLAKYTNGDILEMTRDEWISQINYIKVMLKLLFKTPVTSSMSAESVVPVETSAETESAETAAETIAAEESETEAAVETTIDDNLSSDTAAVQTQTEEGIAVQAIETDTAIEDNAADSDADIEVAVESLDDAQPVAVSPTEEPLTESSARVLVEAAIQEVQNDAAQSSADNDQNTDAITLTDEQINSLVSGLLDGSIAPQSMDEQLYNQLVTVNDKLISIASLVDSNDIEAFVTVYTAMSDIIDQINDRIPENVKALYATVIKYATKENLKGLASSLKYMRTSEAGFDLFEITDNGSAGVSIKKVTTNGFGDRYNHGLRIFEKTDDYWVIGTANPFNGTQLWRTTNLEKNTDIPDSTETETPETDVKPGLMPKPSTTKPTTTVKKPTTSAKKATAKKAAVKTGDESNSTQFIVLMGISAATIFILGYRLRKKEN